MTIRSPLEQAAWALAEATPSYLGRPTTPPLSWRLEGDLLIVILADGRKVRGPMPIMQPVRSKSASALILKERVCPKDGFSQVKSLTHTRPNRKR